MNEHESSAARPARDPHRADEPECDGRAVWLWRLYQRRGGCGAGLEPPEYGEPLDAAMREQLARPPKREGS